MMISATLVVAFGGAWAGDLRLNLTESLPVGLYRIVRTSVGVPRRGELVLACLPMEVAAFALERGYVPRGRCPGGAAPVGKLVAAVPDDTVLVTEAGVLVNGSLLPRTRPLLRDGRRRSLPTSGRRPPVPLVVRAGELWLLSGYSHLRFDSRYFGTIQRSAVTGRLRPLWAAGPP